MTITDTEQADGIRKSALPPASQVRVRFGPGRTQTMPLEWAEAMLTAWREKTPRQFGDALAQAAMDAP
jgi:hypothetical protein